MVQNQFSFKNVSIRILKQVERKVARIYKWWEREVTCEKIWRMGDKLHTTLRLWVMLQDKLMQVARNTLRELEKLCIYCLKRKSWFSRFILSIQSKIRIGSSRRLEENRYGVLY
jgi:hypothetical protein